VITNVGFWGAWSGNLQVHRCSQEPAAAKGCRAHLHDENVAGGSAVGVLPRQQPAEGQGRRRRPGVVCAKWVREHVYGRIRGSVP
jgi:hypothetical protein